MSFALSSAAEAALLIIINLICVGDEHRLPSPFDPGMIIIYGGEISDHKGRQADDDDDDDHHADGDVDDSDDDDSPTGGRVLLWAELAPQLQG